MSAKRCNRRGRGQLATFHLREEAERKLVLSLLAPFSSAWDLSPRDHAATFKVVPLGSVNPIEKVPHPQGQVCLPGDSRPCHSGCFKVSRC